MDRKENRGFNQCIILVLCLITFALHAQQYNFRGFSVADGLAQSQVYAICETSRGYLWVGTRGGGISRFDGRNFVSLSEEDGLVNNYIRAIFEDKAGNLWIGTDEGLSRYDGRKFTNFTVANGLGANTITSIIQDTKGNLWFGTDGGGLSRYDGKSFTSITTKDGLAHNRITCLFLDRDGTFWAGTEWGVSHYVEGSITNFRTKQGLSSNSLRAILRDKDNNLWFATYGGGVSRYDGKKFVSYGMTAGLCNNTVMCMSADKKGNLWFGTASGVSRFDGDTFLTYTETEGLCNNVIMSIILDSQGNLWFGSSGGGICRLDNERFVHFTEKSGQLGSLVYAIEEDTMGQMWFASSNGGVTRYDGIYYTNFRAKDGFTDSKVRCIHEDSSGVLWFGTLGDGAYLCDENAFVHITKDDGLTSSFINGITTDTAGNIWFATSGGGACYYPISRYSIGETHFRKFYGKSGIGTDWVYSVLADKKGNVWLGTRGSGLARISNINDSTPATVTSFKLKRGQGGNTVRNLLLDKSGRIWMGTAGGGIAIFDGKNFRYITKKNGISSNNIYSLLFDEFENLWIGSEKGIDKIVLDKDLKVLSVRRYSRAEGFQGIETVQNASFRDSQGRLWFGTIEGISRYNPKEDVPNNVPPKVHITDVKLFFEDIANTEYGKDLIPWYSVPKSLTLPYRMNHLSFDFAGINLSNPDGVRYKWKLEGFDDRWSPENKATSATYSNLPPGQYTFMVLSANENGVWDKKPSSFSFYISPPFWATFWFRGLAGLLGLGLVYGIFSLRVRSIKRKNAGERARLEMERNLVELEQQALLLQMNPHFIFNSLNSIQGYISQNDIGEAKRYLAKFSKLMRLTLEHSREKFIPLGQEIKLLSNYLDLEQLCRTNVFTYKIETDSQIDEELTGIPPMLIQPFVENAILHGVLPSGRKGEVEIRFSRNQKYLLCTITDNGIGINRSQQEKTISIKDHKSTALEVTKERLQLIGGAKDAVKLIDRSTANPAEQGTRVELHIPYISLAE
jgi:ligand-binding sensor domain-containing protein